MALFRKLRRSLVCLAYFSHGRVYNQAHADVLLTGAGIECLYCTTQKGSPTSAVDITNIFKHLVYIVLGAGTSHNTMYDIFICHVSELALAVRISHTFQSDVITLKEATSTY